MRHDSKVKGISSPEELYGKKIKVKLGKTFIDSHVLVDGEEVACEWVRATCNAPGVVYVSMAIFNENIQTRVDPETFEVAGYLVAEKPE